MKRTRLSSALQNTTTRGRKCWSTATLVLAALSFLACDATPATIRNSKSRGGLALYSIRPTSYDDNRGTNAGSHNHLQRRSIHGSPSTKPSSGISALAFRPNSFRGQSPFPTFNGRDSSDFLGPGSLGQAIPAGARKHFIPPSAEFLNPGPSSTNNKSTSRPINYNNLRSSRSLFFSNVDHEGTLLRYQDERTRQGLPALRLGSIRPGFAFFRHDY
ncbi:unnamed protein product [Notodromas monacha]|uniref:Uncharacterized protein n=1 Tax=Notodromas monacha TaxID=399045 RepID=A0A7R9BVS4_9CRUS|nr:unnamed protein product [Notodromas monacha]CAG0921314.1 unnamed protein product [Notodromas monacha]